MLKVAMRYLRAAGSIMDIFPSTDYVKIVGFRDDLTALKEDSLAIANDMESALDVYGKGMQREHSRHERKPAAGYSTSR